LQHPPMEMNKQGMPPSHVQQKDRHIYHIDPSHLLTTHYSPAQFGQEDEPASDV